MMPQMSCFVWCFHGTMWDILSTIHQDPWSFGLPVFGFVHQEVAVYSVAHLIVLFIYIWFTSKIKVAVSKIARTEHVVQCSQHIVAATSHEKWGSMGTSIHVHPLVSCSCFFRIRRARWLSGSPGVLPEDHLWMM